MTRSPHQPQCCVHTYHGVLVCLCIAGELVTRRDCRALRVALCRVGTMAAFVGLWLFLRDSVPALSPSIKTLVLWTVLLNVGFAYVSVAISHRPHLFKG